jgi:hypothetical protein
MRKLGRAHDKTKRMPFMDDLPFEKYDLSVY